MHCLCACIDVAFPHLLQPNPPPTPTHWDAGCLSLILGELIRISGELRAPDRVRTNCTAELHSDAFRSVFMSVWFGCMSVHLSGWQMRDWPAQALDNRVEHPHPHTCARKHEPAHASSDISKYLLHQRNVCIYSNYVCVTHMYNFFTCDVAHAQRIDCNLPVMLQSAASFVICHNKRWGWGRSDTWSAMRHSLNAYESQAESCTQAWHLCVFVCAVHLFILLCLKTVTCAAEAWCIWLWLKRDQKIKASYCAA